MGVKVVWYGVLIRQGPLVGWSDACQHKAAADGYVDAFVLGEAGSWNTIGDG